MTMRLDDPCTYAATSFPVYPPPTAALARPDNGGAPAQIAEVSTQDESVRMTEDHLERLRAVERTTVDVQLRQREIESRVTSIETKVDANTEVTNSVKADTSEIVALMKGGKVLGQMVKWVGIVDGGIGGTFAAGKGMKWW